MQISATSSYPSDYSIQQQQSNQNGNSDANTIDPAQKNTNNKSDNPDSVKPFSSSDSKLSEDEKKEVEDLKKRDRDVQAHEQAHMAAGAGLVRGGPHYQYQKGPDGRVYAVGGEVSIDTSGGKTPQETLTKMERVRASALAPANPSGQDMQVAAEANSKSAEARAEIAKAQSPNAGKSDNNAAPHQLSAENQRSKSVKPGSTGTASGLHLDLFA